MRFLGFQTTRRQVERRRQLLVLFDIDGTLLQPPSHTHIAAIERASRDVYGVDIVARLSGANDLDGLTSPMIARKLLNRAGISEEHRLTLWESWRETMIRAFLDLEGTLPAQRPLPGATEALRLVLDQGFRAGLLTGNFRRIAMAKLHGANVWDSRLDLAQGAFADDAEDRDILGQIARARADEASLSPIVIVGDTPRDITCARAAGAWAVAVTTGGFSAGHLAGADAVVPSLLDAVRLLVECQRLSADAVTYNQDQPFHHS
jgi:phosphoglycolate phosphatase-like HAD superfamily hydrolase